MRLQGRTKMHDEDDPSILSLADLKGYSIFYICEWKPGVKKIYAIRKYGEGKKLGIFYCKDEGVIDLIDENNQTQDTK
jgi:hypothetical protein